jgi:hypothetical protein
MPYGVRPMPPPARATTLFTADEVRTSRPEDPMKQGHALILALAKLDPVVDGDQREPEAPAPEALPPIRPGAFAGWAHRRPPAPVEPTRQAERGRPVRLRTLREGPPVV